MISFFRITNALRRKLLKLSAEPRPSSSPYLSGDSFRQIADHIFDETGSFDPSSVNENDLVFVKTDMLELFSRSIGPRIASRYRLLCHNSDRNFGDRELSLVDNKVSICFCQNAAVKSERIVPVPIGLENKHYYLNGIPGLFDQLRKNPPKKKTRILYSFSVSTNPGQREPAFRTLKKLELADTLPSFPPPPEYLRKLAEYKFVASPEGNGLDCHRTWEALYLGVVPIVTRSPMTEYFRSLGLPMWIIDSWEELSGLTSRELETKLIELQNPRLEPLQMTYWEKLIKNVSKK